MYLAYFCILFMLFTLTVCFPLDDYNGLPFMVNGRPKGGFLGKPCIKHAKTVDNLQSSEAQWFIQKLDHFKDSDSRTWQQKYYVNASYWKPNGPVFLMIGGEGPLSARWVSVGSMAENAVKFGAIMLALEHRFYGESHPLSDMSTENLQYLSSEQALADLAVFRQAMADQFSMTENNRWISFGGSYPGALSAWFRYKYPHLVYGAIASSAPIQAQLDFPQYLEVSTASLGSTECKTNVKKATASFESYTKTETGLKYLELKFKTCKSVAMNSNDIANFASIAAGNFFGVIQYNKDNREFEGAVGTNITVDVLCGIMNNVEIGDELDRYAYINTMMMKVYKQECLDTNYNDFIGAMKKTDWNSSAAEGGRQWLYQTCTEFGYYQTTDSDQQVFGSLFPLGFSTKQCVDIFGEQFNTTSINRGIDWTNSNYGGYAMKPTRVVFPNGSIDPWHALSFIENTKDIIAIYINGTAHCANMYPSSEDDSEELKAARQQVTSIISQWLIQPNTE